MSNIEEQLSKLKKFKKTEQEIRESLRDIQNWREEDATQKQIRYVYVLAKKLGMSGEEAEAEWDFHYMTRGEINDLINQLEYDAGVVGKDNKDFQHYISKEDLVF